MIGKNLENQLIDLLDRLDNRSNEGEAYKITNEFFLGLGFRYVNIGVASATSGGPLGMFSNMREEWLNHYVDVGYHEYDVMFDYAMAADNARLCDPNSNFELPSRNKAISDRMLKEVQEEGLICSLIIPRHSPVSDHMIGFNLCTDLQIEETQRLYETNRSAIEVGAALAQTAIVEDVEGDNYGKFWLPKASHRKKLSAREKEVLKWLSEGYRNDRIADRLNISNATVNFHMTSIKRKLGAKTREHAIAIALTQKLI